nr:MAG TPA: hypothetical protein [Herelleviridae sp.]
MGTWWRLYNEHGESFSAWSSRRFRLAWKN